MTNLEHDPISRFVEGIGSDVFKYFGKDQGCIVGFGDEGVLYGEGLYRWFKNNKKGMDVTFVTLDRNFEGLDDSKMRGRRVLVVDSGIATGRSYHRIMELVRSRKDALGIKDIKYAVMRDAAGLSDFSLENRGTTLGVPELASIDSMDFKILQILEEDGRLSFASIAKETDLTVSGAKKRFERMVQSGIVEVSGRVIISKFYTTSAFIHVEVALASLPEFIKKLEKLPAVFSLVKTAFLINC